MSCDRGGKGAIARGARRHAGWAAPGTFYCEWSNDADYNSCDREQEQTPDGIIDMLLGHEPGYDGEGDGPAAVVVEAAAAAEAEQRLFDVSLTVAAEGHVHVSLTTAPTKKRKYEAVRLRLQGVKMGRAPRRSGGGGGGLEAAVRTAGRWTKPKGCAFTCRRHIDSKTGTAASLSRGSKEARDSAATWRPSRLR